MSDYVSMWKDLGMDLESHDLLCQVLPTAVGDVFLTQENRPKGMDFWDLVISEVHGIRPKELIEEQKKGRKVFGTFCVYVPDEVILAANGIVTGLCGGSQFWVPGGEAVLPKSTCPLIAWAGPAPSSALRICTWARPPATARKRPTRSWARTCPCTSWTCPR